MRALRTAVTVAPAALLALHRIDAADVWFHLATGRLIATSRGLPSTDPFGAPPAAAWLVHDWLASVILWAVHAVAGAPGLVLLATVACAGAIALPLVLAARDRLPATPFEVAALAATLIAYERFFVRPEIFTFVAVTAWVQLLARGWPRNAGQLVALAALQAAWANLHAAFVLGPALALCAVFGDGYDDLRRSARFRWPPVWRTVLPLVALVACCVNPYGPRLLLHLVRAGRDVGTSELRRGIAEWQPTFATPVLSDLTLLVFAASLALVAFAAIRGRRHARGFEWMAVAALGILACASRRHLAVWAFGALPLAVAWWARAAASAATAAAVRRAAIGAPTSPPAASRGWLRRTAARRLALASRFAPGLVLAVALLLALDIARGSFYRRFGPPRTLGWGVSSADHPIGAAAFVERHALSGPLFNNIAAGSYLIWSAGPRLPVWVDGRLLDAERFATYRRCLEAPAAFDAASSDFRLVVLALQPHAPVRLVRHLYESPEWRLVFLDGEGAVFMRADATPELPPVGLETPLPSGAAPVGSSASRWRGCDPGEAFRRGRVLLDLGFAAAARADLTRALLHCSDRDDVALALGRAALAEGDAAAAVSLLERGAAANPADGDAWFDLGRSYAALGDATRARASWQRALDLQPNHAGAAAALRGAGDDRGR